MREIVRVKFVSTINEQAVCAIFLSNDPKSTFEILLTLTIVAAVIWILENILD
jgi:hypothetical protein